MRLLLGSGGFRTPERIEFLVEHMQPHFGKARKLLFVPYALADHEAYVKMITERGLNGGYELDGIHRHSDPCAAVREAEGIYVGGGNTFRLVTTLHELGLMNAIRQRVREGMPYLGVSAGTNVTCPTLMTTNDMPIVQPPSFETLGLIPFQINPHYFSGQTHVKHDSGDYEQHFGETRDDRIREFHEMNDTPVVGLWEAGIIRVDEGYELLGTPARIFRKGQEPVNVQPGQRLDSWLQ